MPNAATNITPVANHPISLRGIDSVNVPITFRLPDMSITIPIIGPATTPLITADKNRALMGLIPTKFKASPMSVAAAKVQ